MNKECKFPYLSREPLTLSEKNYANRKLEEFKESVDKFTKENTKSKKSARKFLKSIGFEI